MQPIQCPHCQHAVEASAGAGGEVLCPACGSTFRLEQESTRTYIALKRRLGKFELIEQVGSGSFGAVWQARDTELGRIVAVKIPHAGQLASEKEAERFVREARSAAQLRHPGIVTVHEVGRFENVPYIVADFIRGQTLADRLQVGKLEQREAVELVAQVAEALDYAHAMGVVHRDVKPSNIMLERGGSSISSGQGTPLGSAMPGSAGRALLMDFGLALRADVEATMTQEGEVLGTPAYMSPEQAEGRSHKVDARSDVYSLGVVLYRLLTGVLPFQGNARAILDQVLHGEAPAPRKVDRTIDRDLETICLKAMARGAGDRYKTARELGEDLRRYLAGEPIGARPLAFWERGWRWARRRPAAAAAVGLGVVAVLTLVGLGVALGYQTRLRKAFADVAQQKTIAEEQTRIAEREQREAEAARAAEEKLNYFNRFIIAERELSSNNTEIARRILDQCPVELRGWEWNYLNRQCHGELLTLEGHADQVWGLSYSPDGRQIASTGWDNTVRIWDATTGDELRSFALHAWGWQVLFSPDGRRIAVASGHYSKPSEIKVWDVANGAEVLTLLGHTGKIYGLAYSRDGRLLASSDVTGTVKIWEADTGTLRRTIGPEPRGITSVAFSPDGLRLAATLGILDTFAPEPAGTCLLFDVETGEKAGMLQGHRGTITGVGFSPDGTRVATSSYDGDIITWDAVHLREEHRLRGHSQYINGLVFSGDGSRIASASDDGTARIWDAATGSSMLILRGHSGPVNQASFSPDGARLASAGADRTIKVWSAWEAPGVVTLDGADSAACDVAFQPPGGTRVASAHRNGRIYLWDTSSDAMLRAFEGHPLPAWGVAFSPDGRFLATCAGDYARRASPGEVKIWDVATGRAVRSLVGHAGCVWDVIYSPDGRFIASAGGELVNGPGELKLWDAQTGDLLHSFQASPHSGVPAVAFSPDSRLLASAAGDGKVTLWDVASARAIKTIASSSKYVMTLQFDQTGRRLLSGGFDMTIDIWDLAGEPVPRKLGGHANYVMSALFSPDGSRIASASQDRTIKVWDVDAGREVLTLRGHEAPVWSVVFSPDGKRLASASHDGTIKIWDATPLPEAGPGAP